jgi:phosphate starvation-inducible protein PhoH
MLTNLPLSTRGATATNILKALQAVQVQELRRIRGSTLEPALIAEAQCTCHLKQMVSSG